MDLASEKKYIIDRIAEVNDLRLIQLIKGILEYGSRRNDDTSLEAYNQELDEAEIQVLYDGGIDHEDIEAEFK